MAREAIAQMDACLRRMIRRFGRLYAEGMSRRLARQADQLRALNEVGKQIASFLSMDELLPYVVTLLRETFHYYNVNISFLDPENGEMVLRASAGEFMGKPPLGVRVKVGEKGIVGWVAAKGEPLLVNVESTQAGAFGEEDLVALQTLAGQIAVAIENARLHAQAQQAAALGERHGLARELHDSVAQAIYGVTLYAEAATRLLAAGKAAQAAEHLRELGDTAQEALRDMRLLIFELRPPELERVGLAAALRARLEAVEGRAGLETELKVEGEGRPPFEIEEGLYRIAQEALNNALKHAQAHKVTVTLRQDERSVSLEIADDGVGFDPEAVSGKGRGLRGMAERTALMDGELEIESGLGRGTRVRVSVGTRRAHGGS